MINPYNQFPIFKDLDAPQLFLIKEIFFPIDCNEGEVIFEQDSKAEFLYIVVEGEVEIIFKPDDGEPIPVAKIQRGGVFGWSAAFGSGTYTSGAVCIDCATLLKVKGEDLKTLRQTHPETGILILERLAEDITERLERSSTHGQVVALLENALHNGIKPIGG
jgi:CRP-like cAMP-binding protein